MKVKCDKGMSLWSNFVSKDYFLNVKGLGFILDIKLFRRLKVNYKPKVMAV